MAYRASRALDASNIQIAVVVQLMVDATTSGVAFTAEPTTGDVHRVVVSALYGLGEGLVSGGLDADLFEVQKRSGSITPRLAIKEEMFVFDRSRDGGVRREPVEEERRSLPSLSDAQVRDVSDTARRIEEAYGAPQDIEFAFDAAGTLWVLQTRPVTTVQED